jgi:hypothetical protein
MIDNTAFPCDLYNACVHLTAHGSKNDYDYDPGEAEDHSLRGIVATRKHMYGNEKASAGSRTYQGHSHIHAIAKSIETGYWSTDRYLCEVSVISNNSTSARIEDYLQVGMLRQVILIELLQVEDELTPSTLRSLEMFTRLRHLIRIDVVVGSLTWLIRLLPWRLFILCLEILHGNAISRGYDLEQSGQSVDIACQYCRV